MPRTQRTLHFRARTRKKTPHTESQPADRPRMPSMTTPSNAVKAQLDDLFLTPLVETHRLVLFPLHFS